MKDRPLSTAVHCGFHGPLTQRRLSTGALSLASTGDHDVKAGMTPNVLSQQGGPLEEVEHDAQVTHKHVYLMPSSTLKKSSITRP